MIYLGKIKDNHYLVNDHKDVINRIGNINYNIGSYVNRYDGGIAILDIKRRYINCDCGICSKEFSLLEDYKLAYQKYLKLVSLL